MLLHHKRLVLFSRVIGNGCGQPFWFQLQGGYVSEEKTSNAAHQQH
jgi:hypothetical protein